MRSGAGVVSGVSTVGDPTFTDGDGDEKMKFRINYSGSINVDSKDYEDDLIEKFELEDDPEGEDGGKTAEEKLEALTESQLHDYFMDMATDGDLDVEMNIDNIDEVTKI